MERRVCGRERDCSVLSQDNNAPWAGDEAQIRVTASELILFGMTARPEGLYSSYATAVCYLFIYTSNDM